MCLARGVSRSPNSNRAIGTKTGSCETDSQKCFPYGDCSALRHVRPKNSCSWRLRPDSCRDHENTPTSSPPLRGYNEEGWSGERYGCFYNWERWRELVTAAGFSEITHYYRPPGLPREQQPWLASVWWKLTR